MLSIVVTYTDCKLKTAFKRFSILFALRSFSGIIETLNMYCISAYTTYLLRLLISTVMYTDLFAIILHRNKSKFIIWVGGLQGAWVLAMGLARNTVQCTEVLGSNVWRSPTLSSVDKKVYRIKSGICWETYVIRPKIQEKVFWDKIFMEL